jgi:hypothetical protein
MSFLMVNGNRFEKFVPGRLNEEAYSRPQRRVISKMWGCETSREATSPIVIKLG